MKAALRPARAVHPAITTWCEQTRIRPSGSPLGGGAADSRDVHFLVSGWACQARLLQDGDRQIVRLLLPGEIGALHRSACGPFFALTECKVANVPLREVEHAEARDSTLAAVLNAARRLERQIADELVVSLGRRRALARAGHLFFELHHRQGGQGGQPCDMPLSQSELADLLGLSVVHFNRVLQTLRRDGLVELTQRRIVLPDLDRLAAVSDFSPDYLEPGAKDN